MPALVLVFGLQLLCAAHVIRTGRPCQWLFVILALPLAGCLAYFFLEILPELSHSRAARQAVRDIGAVIDPERELRELAERTAEADTVANRAALAEECLRLGRAADAKRLFQSCLTGVHATDHALMLGLAQAQFALDDHAGACETLDRLRAAHPGLDCPGGHLLYARSKEQQGEVEQALLEYAALAAYRPGEEARCRLALLLQKTGRVAEARAQFEQVVRSVERANKILLARRARLVRGRAPQPRRLTARRTITAFGLDCRVKPGTTHGSKRMHRCVRGRCGPARARGSRSSQARA